MPDKLIVEGVPPYDGEYEFETGDLISSLTMGELHRIKGWTGLRAGEFGDAFDAGDTDLSVAFAGVILARNGKHVLIERLMDAPMNAIRIELGVQADDPPEKAQTRKKRSGSGNTGNGPSDASPESDPSPTGDPS